MYLLFSAKAADLKIKGGQRAENKRVMSKCYQPKASHISEVC